MSKFEFITETNSITGGVRYYTEKDGDYVDSTISSDKDSAYEKFIKAASGISLKPKKEVIETIYSIIE
jgi:hypothetical protein